MNRRKYLPSLFITLFWFLGLLFGSISGYYWIFYKELQEKGAVCTGKVIDYTYGRGTRSAPIILYSMNGKSFRYEHQPAIRDGESLYPRNSIVKLLYLPDNPEKAALKSVVETSYVSYIFLGVLIVFVFFPCILYCRQLLQ